MNVQLQQSSTICECPSGSVHGCGVPHPAVPVCPCVLGGAVLEERQRCEAAAAEAVRAHSAQLAAATVAHTEALGQVKAGLASREARITQVRPWSGAEEWLRAAGARDCGLSFALTRRDLRGRGLGGALHDVHKGRCSGRGGGWRSGGCSDPSRVCVRPGMLTRCGVPQLENELASLAHTHDAQLASMNKNWAMERGSLTQGSVLPHTSDPVTPSEPAACPPTHAAP